MKAGSSGATCRRPKPAGALTRRCPEGRTLPCDIRDSTSFRSRSIRCASSKKALPSEVSDMLRVERTSSLMPSRASSALIHRPIMAGAMPSWRAAADRLTSEATATKLSSCLKRLILDEWLARYDERHQLGAHGGEFFRRRAALMADLDVGPTETLYLVCKHGLAVGGGQLHLKGIALGFGCDGATHHQARLFVVKGRADHQRRLVVWTRMALGHREVHVDDVAGIGGIAFAHGVGFSMSATLSRNRLPRGCWRP